MPGKTAPSSRQFDVRKPRREHRREGWGQRFGCRHINHLPVALGTWLPKNMRGEALGIDHPQFMYAERSIEARFAAPVEPERRVGHLHHQQCRLGLEVTQSVAAAVEDEI